jgi:8-oxo-dGTP diphosphatase
MIQVSCALLLHQQRICLAQRARHMRMPLKWEFPGGKKEKNETLMDCLHREMKEEFEIGIKIHGSLEMVEHIYPDFTIQLFPFWCTWISGQLTPKEHQAIEWCKPSELASFDWADADWPIVHQIKNQKLPIF